MPRKSNRKRIFTELELDLGRQPTTAPPQKQQKLSIKSIFNNSMDNKQFISLFKSIKCSDVIKIMNISDYISKEIAEYSVGDVTNCVNNKCKNKVIILQQDINNNLSNNCYCTECIVNTETCKCKRLIFIPNCDKCDLCNRIIKECGNIDYSCSDSKYCCISCDKVLCFNCRIWCECDVDVCHRCYSDYPTLMGGREDESIECGHCEEINFLCAHHPRTTKCYMCGHALDLTKCVPIKKELFEFI